MVTELRSRVLTTTYATSKSRSRRVVESNGFYNPDDQQQSSASEVSIALATAGHLNHEALTTFDPTSQSGNGTNPEVNSIVDPADSVFSNPSMMVYSTKDHDFSSIKDFSELEEATPNVETIFVTSGDATTADSEPPLKKTKVQRGFGLSPWPEHLHPTPEECAEVNRLLSMAHGPSVRPEKLIVNNSVSGCGEVPCVLDALLRTILSLNTTTANSGRAFQGLINRFGLLPMEDIGQDDIKIEGPENKKRKYSGSGAGSVDWDAVRLGPVKDLEESIKVGGLQAKKSKTIKQILDHVWKEGQQRRKQKRREEASNRAIPRNYDYDSDSGLSGISYSDSEEDGELTLDHLHDLDNVALLKKLTSFSGIGYKAASCVMLFSLGRNIFPVDTHIHRLTKFLRWVPETATEVTGFFHLDAKIPDEYKYSLHNLLIRHGRMCKHCKGGPEAKLQGPRNPKQKPKPKKEDLDAEGNPIKVKKTKKMWVGNGLMKEVVIEVETDDEDDGLGDESCILEHLVKRVRKPRKIASK